MDGVPLVIQKLRWANQIIAVPTKLWKVLYCSSEARSAEREHVVAGVVYYVELQKVNIWWRGYRGMILNICCIVFIV